MSVMYNFIVTHYITFNISNSGMSIFPGQHIYNGTFLPVPMSTPPSQAQMVSTVAVPAYSPSKLFCFCNENHIHVHVHVIN